MRIRFSILGYSVSAHFRIRHLWAVEHMHWCIHTYTNVHICTCTYAHCTIHANCQLIVNHLLVDFNRISHTFVSSCISIQNGFKEIKCDYSVDSKNVLTAQYCVSNIIFVLAFALPSSLSLCSDSLQFKRIVSRSRFVSFQARIYGCDLVCLIYRTPTE